MHPFLAPILAACLTIIFVGCKSHPCTCSQQKIDSSINKASLASYNLTVIPITKINSRLKNHKGSPYFNLTTYAKGDKIFLTYITIDSNIVFYNLFDSTEIHVSRFPYKPAPGNLAVLKIKDDSLHMLFLDEKKYVQLAINPDYSLTLIKNMNLGVLFPDNKWYVQYNDYGQPFDYSYPYLLIPYGKRKGDVFYENQSHLLVDIKNLAVKPVIDFPGCYSECYINTRENVSAILKGNEVYGLFALMGQFNRYDLKTGENQFIVIPASAPFVEYDKKEKMNLAYSRKYVLLNEKNVNIFTLGDGGIVLVKQLAKKNFSEKSRYRYYVYDSTRLRSVDEFPGPAAFTQSFKNGFIAFNDSLTKAYYYEKP